MELKEFISKLNENNEKEIIFQSSNNDELKFNCKIKKSLSYDELLEFKGIVKACTTLYDQADIDISNVDESHIVAVMPDNFNIGVAVATLKLYTDLDIGVNVEGAWSLYTNTNIKYRIMENINLEQYEDIIDTCAKMCKLQKGEYLRKVNNVSEELVVELSAMLYSITDIIDKIQSGTDKTNIENLVDDIKREVN